MASFASNIWSYGYDSSSYGYKEFSNQTLPLINFSGCLELKNCTVTGSTKVDGSLEIQRSALNSLEVNGSVEIRKSTISGKTSVSGSLKAVQSVFTNVISIWSTYVSLSDTKTKDLIIHKPSPKQPIQRVVLKNGSEVQGNITFENGEGVVELERGCKITGRVIGGVIRV